MSTELFKSQFKRTVRSPVRIDLAGGTVDIWPIYLLFSSAKTINLGIDLFAESTLEFSPQASTPGVHLESKDQNQFISLSWKDFWSCSHISPSLELHLRLLRFYLSSANAPSSSLESSKLTLTTVAKSPAGAGLGGSSALGISIATNLASWLKTQSEDTIEIMRDIESQILKVPAGLQDYYGANYGGLQKIHWLPGKPLREPYASDTAIEITKRIQLFYSGKSRNSGINNWTMFKAIIDKNSEITEYFNEIVAATSELDLAIRKNDFLGIGQAIRREWTSRKKLAPTITTPELEKAEQISSELGFNAFKICGAGGGGCFFTYKSEPNAQSNSNLEASFKKLGIQKLPFQYAEAEKI